MIDTLGGGITIWTVVNGKTLKLMIGKMTQNSDQKMNDKSSLALAVLHVASVSLDSFVSLGSFASLGRGVSLDKDAFLDMGAGHVSCSKFSLCLEKAFGLFLFTHVVSTHSRIDRQNNGR